MPLGEQSKANTGGTLGSYPAWSFPSGGSPWYRGSFHNVLVAARGIEPHGRAGYEPVPAPCQRRNRKGVEGRSRALNPHYWWTGAEHPLSRRILPPTFGPDQQGQHHHGALVAYRKALLPGISLRLC